MTFVTIENFDINKVVLGDIYSNIKPIPYQVVPIQYKYTSSYTGDLIIRTPKLESQGVYENKERGENKVLNGYSLGLKILNSDDDRQFYDLLLEVTEEINSKVKTVESSLKKMKKRGILTENLEIVKYKDDRSAVAYP